MTTVGGATGAMGVGRGPRARWQALLDIATFGVLVLGVGMFWMRTRPVAATGTVALADSSIGNFRAIGSRGDTLTLPGSEESATLLFVFRSDCPACSRQKAQWRQLAAESERHGHAVFAVTLEELSRDVATYFMGDSVDVLRLLEPSDLEGVLKADAYPTTLVARHGRIAFYHRGVLRPSDTTILRHVLEAGR